MKAYVFPGQGAQFTGMGKDLYENSPLAQELFEKHGFEIANSIIDTMLDENLPEFNQSKIDFWLDVKNDLKRISLAVAS